MQGSRPTAHQAPYLLTYLLTYTYIYAPFLLTRARLNATIPIAARMQSVPARTGDDRTRAGAPPPRAGWRHGADLPSGFVCRCIVPEGRGSLVSRVPKSRQKNFGSLGRSHAGSLTEICRSK